MRRIVVLGCGFGGYHAARELEKSLESRRKVQLTLVTDRSHFLFTPLLPNVVTGEVDITHITFPVRDAFDDSTQIIQTHIEHIDLEARTLKAQDTEIAFDYLLLAPGAGTDWRGPSDWAGDVLTCKTARDATKLREHVAKALQKAHAASSTEARERALTFVFAGAGPTGTELAAEIFSTLLEEVFPTDLTALREATRFMLVDPAETLLPDLPEAVRNRAHDYLNDSGMELELGCAVQDWDGESVELSDGRTIRADNFVWCGGVRPPSLVRDVGFELDPLGRVNVNPDFSVTDHRGVFVIGDAAGLDSSVPMTAQVASQQGPHAAKNILAALDGRAPRPWTYFHKGDLITLGRRHAIASLRGAVIEGRAAWALYRMAYTALMPSGLKKATLLKDWVISNFRPGGSRAVAPSWRRAIGEGQPRRLSSD